MRIVKRQKMQILLKNLPQELQVQVKHVLSSSAEQITTQMKARVPTRTGKLRASIGYSIGAKPSRKVFVTSKFGGEGFLAAYIYAGDRSGKGSAFYAHFVEFGTKAHRISSRDGGLLRLADNRFLKSVYHTGARAKPFFYPVWRVMQPRVTREMRAGLRKVIRNWNR